VSCKAAPLLPVQKQANKSATLSCCSMGTPGRPLRSLLCTLAACLALTAVINWLLLRFQLHNWQEGARLAAALLLIDVCLNARWVPGQVLRLCAGCDGVLLLKLAGKASWEPAAACKGIVDGCYGAGGVQRRISGAGPLTGTTSTLCYYMEGGYLLAHHPASCVLCNSGTTFWRGGRQSCSCCTLAFTP
jgi:hypothetical protein